MDKTVLMNLEKDKLLIYLKQNSNFIKELHRNPSNYENFKKTIKEKYNLRFSDKVSNVIDDIELVSSIISTLN